MLSEEEFLLMLDEELGLVLEPGDLGRDVDELAGWDSVYLLRLLSALEARIERPLSLPALLEVRTLGAVRELAVSGD